MRKTCGGQSDLLVQGLLHAEAVYRLRHHVPGDAVSVPVRGVREESGCRVQQARLGEAEAQDGAAEGRVRTETLSLTGHVPSKKNNYRRTRSGGLMVDPEIQSHINALVDEARLKWGKRQPFKKAIIAADFYVRDRRADLDNKYVTLSDVLVKAGVLANDNINCVRSFTAVALVEKREGVRVTLSEVQE